MYHQKKLSSGNENYKNSISPLCLKRGFQWMKPPALTFGSTRVQIQCGSPFFFPFSKGCLKNLRSLPYRNGCRMYDSMCRIDSELKLDDVQFRDYSSVFG